MRKRLLEYVLGRLTSYYPLRVGPDILLRRRNAKHFKRMRAWARMTQAEVLGHLLALYRVNCVLDVGANVGQFGRHLRRLGYAGRILSLEPTGDSYRDLETAAAGDPQWHTFRLAAGGEDSVMEINVTGASLFSSFLAPNTLAAGHFGPSATVSRRETVTVRRLDALLTAALADLPTPRLFLKMDTQGYDLVAFSGLGAWIERVVVLQSEVSVIPIYEGMPSHMDSLRTFEAQGFYLAGMTPVSWDERTTQLIEYDCIMVRPEALAEGA